MAKARSALAIINSKLAALGARYHKELPLNEIRSIIADGGFDAKNLEGIYCGDDGRSHDQVSDKYFIHLSWHKMESGNFEVVAYVN